MYNMDNKAVAFVDANGDLIPKVKLEPWTELYTSPTQVNEQLLEALELASCCVSDDSTYDKEVKKKIEAAIEQALTVKPAPLVGLTGSELLEAYMRGRDHHGSNVREAIHISGLKYVQDAVIAKNGGK